MGCLDEHCICLVLEHMQIPHFILGHFLDHGFTSWRAENEVSIVLCPTNSTYTSTIYKFTSGLLDIVSI
jgi:hypothetical protein